MLHNLKMYDALMKMRSNPNVFGAGLSVRLNIGPMNSGTPVDVELAAGEPLLTDVIDAVATAMRDTMQLQLVAVRREQAEATDAILFYERSGVAKAVK